MSILANLFNNETIKKAAFGQLKKAMADAGADFATVRIDEAGEIQVQTHKDEFALVMTRKDYDEVNRIYSAWLSGLLIEKEDFNGK